MLTGSVSLKFENIRKSVADAPGVPPPPGPGEVQTRDQATGLTTVRAFPLPAGFVYDGKVNEAFYATIPAITGFYQVLPDAGKEATERTEAWVFYDNKNVYVAARMWVKDMHTLIANELRRDKARQNDDFEIGRAHV